MDKEDLFWLRLWQSILGLLVVFILTTGSCTMHRNSLISQAILEGGNPLQVGCAYGVDNSRDVCLQQAAK